MLFCLLNTYKEPPHSFIHGPVLYSSAALLGFVLRIYSASHYFLPLATLLLLWHQLALTVTVICYWKKSLPSMSLLINLLQKPAYCNMKSWVQRFCFLFDCCILGIYYAWHIENILKKCLWNERNIKGFICSRKFIDCLLCVRHSARCWNI